MWRFFYRRIRDETIPWFTVYGYSGLWLMAHGMWFRVLGHDLAVAWPDHGLAKANGTWESRDLRLRCHWAHGQVIAMKDEPP